MTSKQRITVTVDPDLVEAGVSAVERGDAESVSAWVSEAMSEKALRDRRLARLRDAVADYEAEFGSIDEEEIAAVRRADRRTATVVRGRGKVGAAKAGRSS